MDVLVLVPRRPEPWRDKLWRYVSGVWAGWPLREGHDRAEPFNRSAARNQAAQGAWDVAVFADADTVPDLPLVDQAIEIAESTGRLVCPQHEFRSLTRSSTNAVLAGDIAPHKAATRWVYPNPKSSCIVVPRSLWDDVGGYDERFCGWGFEDASFYHACEALGGVIRLAGACSHLWHPRSPDKDKNLPGYVANEQLGRRYKAARHDADAMRTILEEQVVAA